MDPVGHQDSDPGTAGVIVRPPILFGIAVLLGFAADHLLPLPFPISRPGLDHWISACVAGAMFVIGTTLVAAEPSIVNRSSNTPFEFVWLDTISPSYLQTSIR